MNLNKSLHIKGRGHEVTLEKKLIISQIVSISFVILNT